MAWFQRQRSSRGHKEHSIPVELFGKGIACLPHLVPTYRSYHVMPADPRGAL
jgi:hypothetical protein